MQRIAAVLASLFASRIASAAPGELAIPIEPSTPSEALVPDARVARHAVSGATATLRGGYDDSTGAGIASGAVEATVIDRLAVRLAFARDAIAERAHASGGIAVDVLRQTSAGVDLAVAGEYDQRGWNRVPAVVARVVVARVLADVALHGNAAVGFGTEDGEHYGEVGLAALYSLMPRLALGIAGHGAIDLERDADEPEAEPDWGVQVGPVATYNVGRVALSAFAGLSMWKQRLVDTTYAGIQGSLAAGLAF